MEEARFGAGEIMKAIESAKETIRRYQRSMRDSQERIDRLKKALRQIPKKGRWTPLRLKKIFINKAVKLVIGRAYLVKGRCGVGLQEWTNHGWNHLNDSNVSPLTHVWLPKRKKT